MDPSDVAAATPRSNAARWLAAAAVFGLAACSEAPPPPLQARVVLAASGQDVTDAAQIRLDRVVATQGEGAIRFRYVRSIPRGDDGRFDLTGLSSEDRAALRLSARFSAGARERLLTASEISSGEVVLRIDGALAIARVRRSPNAGGANVLLRVSAEASDAVITAAPRRDLMDDAAPSVAIMLLPSGPLAFELGVGDEVLDALQVTLEPGEVREVALDGRVAAATLTVAVAPRWPSGAETPVAVALETTTSPERAARRVVHGAADVAIDLGRLGAAPYAAVITVAPDARFEEAWVEETVEFRLDDDELDAGAAARRIEIETTAVRATLLDAERAAVAVDDQGEPVIWRVLDTPRGGPVSAAPADGDGRARMRFFPIEGERYVLAAQQGGGYVAFAEMSAEQTALGAVSEADVALGDGRAICLELFSESLCEGVSAPSE